MKTKRIISVIMSVIMTVLTVTIGATVNTSFAANTSNSVYSEVLSQYLEFQKELDQHKSSSYYDKYINEHKYISEGFNEVYYFTSLSVIHFAFYDIDKNGTNELIIGVPSESVGHYVVAVYTYSNNKIIELGCMGFHSYMEIFSTGYILKGAFVNQMGLAYAVYQISNGSSLKLVDSLSYAYASTSDTYYQNNNRVSKSTFDQKFIKYTGSNYDTYSLKGGAKEAKLSWNKLVIPSATTLSSISSTTTGVKISWNSANNAKKYNVYRKTSPSDSWKKIGDTTSLSYTDKTAVSGTKYYYTVRAVNDVGSGSYNKSGLSILYVASPTVTLTNSTNGVNINWNKISGVDGYYIYRKTKNGTYSMIKQITSVGTVSYLDKEVKYNGGTEYVYAVRAYKGTDRSGYTGVNIIRLTNPVVKASNASAGMNVKWEKVTGAKGYYVYRTNSAGKYERIATVSGGDTLSYQDKAVKSNNGTKYQYTVRAYNGSYASSYTGVTNIRLTTNSISSLTNDTSNTITVKYTKNDKASGYQIQYSTSSTFASGNTSVKTTALSKSISDLTKGNTYYVRVRSYKTVDGVTYYAGWTGTKSVKIAK